MADSPIGAQMSDAKFPDTPAWAAAWLCLWAMTGSAARLSKDGVCFEYSDVAPSTEMRRLLQLLLNATPAGVEMIGEYLRRFGDQLLASEVAQ